MSRVSIKQTCDEHENMFSSYCKKHDKVLCSLCVESQHKSCHDIIDLWDVAKDARSSVALMDLEETISVGLKNIQTFIQNTSSKYFDEQEHDIKVKIRELRTRINNHLDKIEQDLIEELEFKLAECKSKHEVVLENMKEFDIFMKRINDQTIELRNFSSDVHIFLGTRQLSNEVRECLKATSYDYVLDEYILNIETNSILNSLLTNVKTFGNISTKVRKINVPISQPKIRQTQVNVTRSVRDVGVQLKQTFTIAKEGLSMYLTGCTILPNGHVLIVDNDGNTQLKEYNQNGTHVRDIMVSSKPFDVTVIDVAKVGVSYGESSYIEILNIQNTTVEQKVPLNNYSFGLYFQGGKLYIAVGRHDIVITELSGKIVKTLRINADTMFYVTATADKIYYTDYHTQTVTCCDMSGEEIWKFQDDSVQRPFGLTVDNNQNVYVVGRNSDTLTIISRDGKTSKTLLTESDGLKYPQAIHFSQDTGDLFVCNCSDTKAFLLKIP